MSGFYSADSLTPIDQYLDHEEELKVESPRVEFLIEYAQAVMASEEFRKAFELSADPSNFASGFLVDLGSGKPEELLDILRRLKRRFLENHGLFDQVKKHSFAFNAVFELMRAYEADPKGSLEDYLRSELPKSIYVKEFYEAPAYLDGTLVRNRTPMSPEERAKFSPSIEFLMAYAKEVFVNEKIQALMDLESDPDLFNYDQKIEDLAQLQRKLGREYLESIGQFDREKLYGLSLFAVRKLIRAYRDNPKKNTESIEDFLRAELRKSIYVKEYYDDLD